MQNRKRTEGIKTVFIRLLVAYLAALPLMQKQMQSAG
jgi:hypothetical protein